MTVDDGGGGGGDCSVLSGNALSSRPAFFCGTVENRLASLVLHSEGDFLANAPKFGPVKLAAQS